MAPPQRPLSSLPLQVLLYFDGWFATLYFAYNILLYIYKGEAIAGIQKKDARNCYRLLILLPAVHNLARDHRHCCAHCRPMGAIIFEFKVEQDRDDATNDLELVANAGGGDNTRLLSRAPGLRVSVARFLF